MLHFTSDQFVQWLGIYFWPMLRIMALISTAPILSEKSVPKRVKIGLGMVITIIVAPTLPAVDIPIFSPNAIWIALQQVMIGVAVGFTMQLAFAAVRTAGELIGLQMGLSFATLVDPGSHPNMPVLARTIDLLAMLLFLSFNGHLWLISMLVYTFLTLPTGEIPVNGNAFLAFTRAPGIAVLVSPMSINAFLALTRAAGLVFLKGLMLALPSITLLLTVILALGLLNRMAPQLSVFVIGFPLTLTVGILLMSLLMPLIAPFCEHL